MPKILRLFLLLAIVGMLASPFLFAGKVSLITTYEVVDMTYKSGQNARVETPEGQPETAQKVVYTWVAVPELHIRETPQGTILGIVRNGEVLIVIAPPVGGWVLVSDGNGLVGWVAVEYTGLGK